jgi:lipoprotein-anchoring transpeptidase ErfK/SrfK
VDVKRIACCLVVAIGVAVSAPAPGAASPTGTAGRAAASAVSHWAYVETPVFVRRDPRLGAKRLARLRPWTYHGRPETVLVLGWASHEGRTWTQVRFPGLGSRRGWVPSRALSAPRPNRLRLVLDRARLELRLLRGGRTLFSTAVGVGAFGSPTPAGHYYIRERIAPSSPGSIYGALAFGTSAYSPYRTDWPGGGQVGIHGTNQPGLIPGRISNGCVRLPDSRVLVLGRKLQLGTRLLIK